MNLAKEKANQYTEILDKPSASDTVDTVKTKAPVTKRTSKVKSFVDLINNYADTAVLRSHIGSYPKEVLESYQDADGLDVLHHAIISNNVEAVSLLFFKGMFKKPIDPRIEGVPYLHLAARLGHNTILSMLLQERPRDNKPDVFTYKVKESETTEIGDEEVKKKPIDLAAEGGHLKCIRNILDHFQGNRSKVGKITGKEAYVNLACQLDSPSALRLLLSQDSTQDDVKSAVAAALKMARPECLDVLLRMQPDLSTLFEGMNLYHVLYSYSLSFDKNWYESLLSVTTVLIRHKQSFHCSVPFRTYPVYSLLAHDSCHNFEVTAPYRIACLLLLLKAGADPNFDEVEFETQNKDAGCRTAFGRSAYPSALHCLFDTVNKYAEVMESTFYLKKYISKCTEVLLKYNANPNTVGLLTEDSEDLGNSLHCFCRTSVRTGVDRNALILLLGYGGDPEVKCNNLYPVGLFCDAIVCRGDITKDAVEYEIEQLSAVFEAMSFQTLRDARETFMNGIREKYNSLESNAKDVAACIQSAFDAHLSKVRTLKKLCILQIWTSCQRQLSNILQLPIPKKLKLDITGVSS